LAQASSPPVLSRAMASALANPGLQLLAALLLVGRQLATRQRGSVSVAALALLAVVRQLLANRRPSCRSLRGPTGAASAATVSQQNVQRQAAIAWGGATDHTGNVTLVPDKSFDINKTIFKALEGALVRFLMKGKIGNKLFWSDTAVSAIQASYSKMPAAPSIDQAIHTFMIEECDFSMEHADGSFMDHLNFCHEYSAAHFKEHSPKVLFLHSIMGVGTNAFPMGKDKISKLESMLTDFEFKHIEAFPSILRLLTEQTLLETMSASHERLHKLKSITFHRVIDNKVVTMEAEDLWIQLNYQVIHLLDFLPAACWAALLGDPLFQTFVELLTFLRRAGQLRAHVDFEHPSGQTSLEGQPLTLASYIHCHLPSKVTRKMQRKAIRRFSGQIGHSLQFELRWQA